MIDDLDSPSPKFLDTRAVQALDTLIARSVGQSPDGYFQVWCYAQIEKGRVTQVGVSPVVGESVRFVDGGRRR